MAERKKPEVELFIKASNIDGVRNGACIFCHKWFMVLFQKSKANELALTVTTVNMKQYPKEIKELTHSQPPILLNEDLAMPEERILDHLREEFPDPGMFAANNTVKKKIENVYSKFNHYLAATTEENEQRVEKSLVSELQTINNHLAHQGTTYLCGDHLSIYDCELMPKLQHIRVAGRAYKKFEIPASLTALWTYIANMYQLDAFRETCPADQDIIANYRGKAKSDYIGSPRAQEALELPTYSLEIPTQLASKYINNGINHRTPSPYTAGLNHHRRSNQMSPLSDHDINNPIDYHITPPSNRPPSSSNSNTNITMNNSNDSPYGHHNYQHVNAHNPTSSGSNSNRSSQIMTHNNNGTESPPGDYND